MDSNNLIILITARTNVNAHSDYVVLFYSEMADHVRTFHVYLTLKIGVVGLRLNAAQKRSSAKAVDRSVSLSNTGSHCRKMITIVYQYSYKAMAGK